MSGCFTRYHLSHKILLCGDLNVTLLPTRNNKHDIVLKDFARGHCVLTGSYHSVQPTFYHFNGVVSSQIDYVLSKVPSLFQSYLILGKDICNVSSHVPIPVQIQFPEQVPSVTSTLNKPSKTIYFWAKVDSDKYNDILQQSLFKVSNNNVDETVANMTNCLKEAAQPSIPSKTFVFKGPKRRVLSQVLHSLRKVKDT